MSNPNPDYTGLIAAIVGLVAAITALINWYVTSRTAKKIDGVRRKIPGKKRGDRAAPAVEQTGSDCEPGSKS